MMAAARKDRFRLDWIADGLGAGGGEARHATRLDFFFFFT
jgi:hypothetical protein